MKKFLNLILFVSASLALNSCLVDDDGGNYVNNDQSPNLLGFTQSTVNASVTADGEEKPLSFPVELAGPTAFQYEGEITVTIEVDPSSTAVEGVHYSLSSNTVTLSSASNLTANFPVTIITDGIDPPIDPTPVLKLNIVSASDSSILPNGRTSSITIYIEYLCYSDITGFYETLDALYYRIGVLTYDEAVWPDEQEIIYICNGTFRVLEWFGPFNGNEWYFQVDELGNITYPPTTPTGDPQQGNGQPFITCDTNPGDFSDVPCGASSNYVDTSGGEITLYMTWGYYTPNSGPRTFYQVIRKL